MSGSSADKNGRAWRRLGALTGLALTLGACNYTTGEVVATIPQLGEAWDVDRRSGRMVLTQAVGTAGARIIVLMNWLDEFRRTAAATR